MENTDEGFCRKPLGPWIAGLVVTTVMFVFWIVMKKEEIIKGAEHESLNKPLPPKMSEPRFPGAVTQAAYQPNLQPAAITKATPNGGMQLVAGTMNANITDSRFQNNLKDAVNMILPSVCDIHASRLPQAPVNQNVNPDNFQFVPPFKGTIDKFVDNKGFENVGAGIFVDDRGYVLTNYHVTRDATDVVVTIWNGGGTTTDLRADIIASEPSMDLALLKVRADGPFPEVRIGDSSFTQIGDYVVAVGSPFGIEQTVTSGIISGIRKSIMIENVRYENLFQTDAPINHGSSGGPLVNLKGEVIGINTAIYAPTGVFSGTGFAIPINDCKNFLSQALKKNFAVPLDQRGLVMQPLPPTNFVPDAPAPVHFGLEVMPINDVIAKQFNIQPGDGVLVNRVMDELPASLAGIKRGDIITGIAGVRISSAEDMRAVVSHFHAGDNVNIHILRNGQINELLVRLM
ncbi:MAG: trypsin-like peptidase domain-containing protein [Candidatus Omnitrophica bacterium]|nr:trypsin-like peptidase domain-containing protein [Candidatus Omnitrophota bacterium]